MASKLASSTPLPAVVLELILMGARPCAGETNKKLGNEPHQSLSLPNWLLDVSAEVAPFLQSNARPLQTTSHVGRQRLNGSDSLTSDSHIGDTEKYGLPTFKTSWPVSDVAQWQIQPAPYANKLPCRLLRVCLCV